MLTAQEINFLYDGPMKPFLMALRAQVIPAALIPFLYDIRPPVSFVDGCLVVEIQDFRKVPEVRSRVVMRPAPETLPLTIDNMLSRRQERWDDNMTLELESRIMVGGIFGPADNRPPHHHRCTWEHRSWRRGTLPCRSR